MTQDTEPLSLDALLIKCKAEGKWCNATTDEQATIVTATGARSHGRIVNWYGPAECELDNGKRGVLLGTWLRRESVT